MIFLAITEKALIARWLMVFCGRVRYYRIRIKKESPVEGPEKIVISSLPYVKLFRISNVFQRF
jgi:hypothetical protein